MQLERIEFTVDDRPPKKDGAQSLWSSNQAKLVLKLRKKALEAQKEAGITNHFDCPVRLELTIFAPNITKLGDHTYVGDLDSYIAGVCESLKPSDKQVIPHEIFQGEDDVDPRKPLIIKDDSQVVSVKATKIQSNTLYYTVMVEAIE